MISLLDFSQNKADFTPVQSPPARARWPQTIIWPSGAKVAVGEQWSRDDRGEIIAIYHDREELELCLTLTQWIREWDQPLTQAELFAQQRHNYAYED